MVVGVVVGSVAVAVVAYAVGTGRGGTTLVVGPGASVTGSPRVETLLSPSTLPAGNAARPEIAGQFGGIPTCPAQSSTGSQPAATVHVDVSGYPGRLTKHCLYAKRGVVDIVFRDEVVNPTTGLVVPEAFQVSSTGAAAIGGSAAIGWIYDTSAGLGLSPTVLSSDPIDVRIPALTPGTYYVGLITESMAAPAVLTVGR